MPQDIAAFEGYRSSLLRTALFALLCVLTAGVAFVLTRWYLRFRVALTLVRCPLAQADHVVVTVRACLNTHAWLLLGASSRGEHASGAGAAGEARRSSHRLAAAVDRRRRCLPISPSPAQLVDGRQDLVRVHRSASFSECCAVREEES